MKASLPGAWLGPWLVAAVVALGALALASAAESAESAEAPQSGRSRFVDPADGWLDMSQFLDTAYGFVPIIVPITEPAVGYGGIGALVFIDRQAPGSQGAFARPNIAAIGGLRTENGTEGFFGGHLGTWLDGKLRTQVALADMDVNLDFFGLGGNRTPGEVGFGYSISARGGMAGASYRYAESPLWMGLKYTQVSTGVALDAPGAGLPGVARSDFDLELTGITPSLTLDMRDNFFTPTSGWYVDLSIPVFRKAAGGDRDFEKLDLTAIHFRPLGNSVFFSARGTGKASSAGTPFFLRPYVALRGVQALRYQGERAAEAEGELRWQAHPRFSVVGFAGTGVVRGGPATGDRGKTVVAGGAGVRYLLARKHGLHLGLDMAAGPDGKPIFYVVFGNAWLRP